MDSDATKGSFMCEGFRVENNSYVISAPLTSPRVIAKKSVFKCFEIDQSLLHLSAYKWLSAVYLFVFVGTQNINLTKIHNGYYDMPNVKK